MLRLNALVCRADLNLSPELLKGVESLGFRKPSKIQAAALPLVLNHRENLIAQAQNGSGKTATFALSMLSCVDEALPMPQARKRETERDSQRLLLFPVCGFAVLTFCAVCIWDSFSGAVYLPNSRAGAADSGCPQRPLPFHASGHLPRRPPNASR